MSPGRDLPDITRRILERVSQVLEDGDRLCNEERHLLQSQVSLILSSWWEEAAARDGDTMAEFKSIYSDELDRAVEHVVATFEILRGVARRDYAHVSQAILRVIH